jgi:hypothetical protein
MVQQIAMIPGAVTLRILQYLDFDELYRIAHPNCHFSGALPSLEITFFHLRQLLRARRVPWARRRIDKQNVFSPGACIVADCSSERITLIDLTHPRASTFTLSPYCSNCSMKFSQYRVPPPMQVVHH